MSELSVDKMALNIDNLTSMEQIKHVKWLPSNVSELAIVPQAKF
jgi:hypothetical protein